DDLRAAVAGVHDRDSREEIDVLASRLVPDLRPQSAVDHDRLHRLQEVGVDVAAVLLDRVHADLLTAPSAQACRNACQPGIPVTPPPACVAQEPWYSPLIGVR